MTAPRSCWWRSFSTERDVTFFGDELAASVRRDLQTVRDILDESKAEMPNETPVDVIRSLTEQEPEPVRRWSFADVSPAERFCWSVVCVLVVWFAWALTNASLYATAP